MKLTASKNLGSLDGEAGWSEAQALNDHGQVVGNTDIGNEEHAFLYDSVRGMQDLGTLGGDRSYAQDINNAGQIVGYSLDENKYWRAFMYENGTMLDLNSLVDSASLGEWVLAFAYGINNNSEIVGLAYNHNVGVQGFLLSKHISPVPVPGAIFLLAPALLGIIGLRRKVQVN